MNKYKILRKYVRNGAFTNFSISLAMYKNKKCKIAGMAKSFNEIVAGSGWLRK